MKIEGREINRKSKPIFVSEEISDNRATGLWGFGDKEANRRYSVFFKYLDGGRERPLYYSFKTMENAVAYRDGLKSTIQTITLEK